MANNTMNAESVNVDYINDYIGTDDENHGKILLSAMNQRDVELANIMCSTKLLICDANTLGITLGFGIEAMLPSRKIVQNRIQVTVRPWAIRKHGSMVFDITNKIVEVLSKTIRLINSYGCFIAGGNEISYLKATDCAFDSVIKISYIRYKEL